MGVAIIQQKVSATNNFDATLPPGSPAYDKDIKRFPVAVAGGLFDFAVTGPHVIRAVELVLGGQSAWSIAKKDSDGLEIVLWSGTTDTEFLLPSGDSYLLFQGEELLVRTTGATGALVCRIAVERY